jgi:hypothetical protein
MSFHGEIFSQREALIEMAVLLAQVTAIIILALTNAVE